MLVVPLALGNSTNICSGSKRARGNRAAANKSKAIIISERKRANPLALTHTQADTTV